MWGCHFNSSSVVTPRTPCWRTCTIIFAPRVRLSVRSFSWRFFVCSLISCSLSSGGDIHCNFGRMNEWKLHTVHTNILKKSTQNLACSQRQIRTVHTGKLSQAKNYQQTFIPIKYKKPPPPNPDRTILIYQLNLLEDNIWLILHPSHVSESSYHLQKDHTQLWYL